jgi:hypothetical protein
MADTIWGQIQAILGPGVYELLVTREGDGNVFNYGPMEQIRIGALTDPEAGIVPDPDRKRLIDKHVRCSILGRESTETLVADVTVL